MPYMERLSPATTIHMAPKKPYAQCNSELDWGRQENIGIASLACPNCSSSNLGGGICCFRSDARLEPYSDVSMALEGDKAKRLAARKGEPMNFMALQHPLLYQRQPKHKPKKERPGVWSCHDQTAGHQVHGQDGSCRSERHC